MQGKLIVKQLRKKAKQGKIDTVIVAFPDIYGRLIGKRFTADFFLDSAAKHGTHACNYLLTADMEMEPLPGFDFANWEKGYGDFHLQPDFSTLRRAAWLKKTALVICDITEGEKHRPVSVAPRSILQRQIQKMHRAGYTAFAASELEYYLFENDYRSAHAAGYRDLRPVGWYLEDYHILQGTRTEKFTAAARKYLQKSAVPVETSKGEWGLGQHEINVRYADIGESADRHLVFKQCVKETAMAQNLSVTFMAKYKADGAGSSCHIHLSLHRDGKNAFVGDKKFGNLRASETFGYFLGGCLKYAAELTPFYAPTVNSYKRYADASWAPTRLAWSADNRTAGFRVVGSGESLRIECRIPGADCNPYLAYAALSASGLAGIENKIKVPEMFVGDVYAAKDLPEIPKTLRAANELFKQSKFAKKAFDEEVVKHYAHHFASEQKAYDAAVTDWERERYFERG